MQEILARSASLLMGEEPDDMDRAKESLAGYHSTMHGVRPRDVRARGRGRGDAALVSRVERWMASGWKRNTSV
ncbi:hypothetical protein [Streptomyces sp. NPDC047968]|uniref:hypothetical protein n=1 Tax=unclassified Streptomyces TaxID=2593676 RepID=UPI00343E61BB